VALGIAPSPARAHHVAGGSEVDPEVRQWLGARTVKVLVAADRAEIVRVDPAQIARPAGAKSPPNVGGYPMVGQPRALSSALLEDFRDVLLDRTTHDIPPPNVYSGKLCGPIKPGVALRFWAKADTARRAPLEILLCFFCDDLLVVGQSGYAQSMTPGALALLRLSAAALPDVAELEEMLARGSQESARERLFDSLFPADIQLAMRGDSMGGEKEWQTDASAVQLRARFPPPELVRLIARALALKDGNSFLLDRRTQVVVGAVRGLTDAQLLAGLQAIRGDQLALAGASELFRHGLGDRLPPEVRAEWLPLLTEAALVQEGNAPRCSLALSLGSYGAKGVTLLLKLRRAEIVFPRTTAAAWTHRDDPSPSACALLALVRADPTKAADELRNWHPGEPLDIAVARIVGAALGEGDVADAGLFKTESTMVALATLEVYRTHPTVAGVDVLVGEAIGHRYGLVRERAAKVFTALTGFDLGATPEDDRPSQAQTWWKAHRDTWRPPAAKPR
jgi:hypothetical protein